jgi:CBS domain containing-hemolysin-like protein
VLSPLLWLVGSIGLGIARLLGAGEKVTTHVTEGELRTALDTAEEEGIIDSEERAMIEGAMDFREKLVREVMTPRLDIVAIPAESSLPQALDIAMSEGHSRLPVYEGSLDRIVGVIAAKDLIPHLQRQRANGSADGQELSARAVVRPAFFVPENKKIASTLEELRHQRLLMALVVDADGATTGLVTLEDLLEEIVGEIQDEYDVEEPPLRILSHAPRTSTPDGEEESSIMNAVMVPAAADQPAASNAVACDASVTVRDFERFWQRSFGDVAELAIDDEDADPSLSLAAIALQLFESIPQPGDRVAAGAIRGSSKNAQRTIELEVMAMDGPRIEELKMSEVVGATDE